MRKHRRFGVGMSEEEELVTLLADRGEKVTTAESFTGGLIISSLIDVAGASQVTEEAYVVYSDRAKHDNLGVSQTSLAEHTAVSAEVCQEMLEGLAQKTQCQLALASTGYAGPSGADVGHCFVGALYKGQARVLELWLQGDRRSIRETGAEEAIHLGLEAMKGEEDDKDHLRI